MVDRYENYIIILVMFLIFTGVPVLPFLSDQRYFPGHSDALWVDIRGWTLYRTGSPVFEGPLDLLLHLVQKNKINIYDIPIAELLEQYLEAIRQWKEADLEVASEFFGDGGPAGTD